MDQTELGLKRFDAGAEFLESANKLGLRPEALFWAYDSKIEQFVLVLVTNFFDFAGPLELSKRLFAAYNASALPQEIDPFIIRTHSPHQKIYRELSIFLKSHMALDPVDRIHSAREILAGTRDRFGRFELQYGDLQSWDTWVYYVAPKIKRPIEAEPAWRRFDRAVHALAA